MIKGKKLEKLLVGPDVNLHHAMETMTKSPGTPIIVVVDGERRLLGVVVDFDIRTALLQGKTLETPVSEVMNGNPFWLPVNTAPQRISMVFRSRPHRALPLLDEARRVVGLALITEYLTPTATKPNTVVLMAGGLGTRLRPLTNSQPKPMVEVGNKPLLETTLQSFIDFGFDKFYISVNYLGQQIKDYFQNGERWGISIKYLEEDAPLGTAGALSLIEAPLAHPFIVMNGDLLTRTDFTSLLEFHQTNHFAATLCVREHWQELPYGVVEASGCVLNEIIEKPLYRVLVNAGIYVLSPWVLGSLAPGQRLDMPDLLCRIKEQPEQNVGCFPVSEYWLDVGRIPDYERAQRDYSLHFKENPSCRLNS